MGPVKEILKDLVQLPVHFNFLIFFLHTATPTDTRWPETERLTTFDLQFASLRIHWEELQVHVTDGRYGKTGIIKVTIEQLQLKIGIL